MATHLSCLSNLIILYKFGRPSKVAQTPFTTLWAVRTEDRSMPFITPGLLFNVFFSLTRKGKLYHPPAYSYGRIESVLNNLLIMAGPLTFYERLSCLLTDCQIILSNKEQTSIAKQPKGNSGLLIQTTSDTTRSWTPIVFSYLYSSCLFNSPSLCL